MGFFDKLFGSKPEAASVEKEEPKPACEHQWERVVEAVGRTVSVNTKCAKCGDVMPPKRTVHYDMR